MASKNDKVSDSLQEAPITSYSTEAANGAIDTLGSVIRVLGNESFPLGSDVEAAEFESTCAEFAGHVENGAAVPAYDIKRADTGRREWSVVQRFLVDRRRNEKKFVSDRLTGYRGIVDDLVSGLRQFAIRDKTTEASVCDCLAEVEAAIARESSGSDELPNLKVALADTISNVKSIFAEQQASYEAQLKELNDRLSSLRDDLDSAREEMKRDSLTQTFNRPGFDSAIARNLNIHLFSRQPLTLLMIDLDEFKYVNDTYGHQAGDAVLRAVGICLERSFIRKNDIVARYGGDEFAVILADTSAKNALTVAERFMDRLRNTIVESGDHSIALTCSVGFTEAEEGDCVESFIERADQALLSAKAQGRNRCVSL